MVLFDECKGIENIKAKEPNLVFGVRVEGKGSRFYFRLPRIERMLICFLPLVCCPTH